MILVDPPWDSWDGGPSNRIGLEPPCDTDCPPKRGTDRRLVELILLLIELNGWWFLFNKILPGVTHAPFLTSLGPSSQQLSRSSARSNPCAQAEHPRRPGRRKLHRQVTPDTHISPTRPSGHSRRVVGSTIQRSLGTQGVFMDGPH